MVSFKRPYSFWNSFLQKLVESTIAQKAELCIAVVKDGTVLWVHDFEVRLKLFLEGLNHLVIHEIAFSVSIENLAKLNRLVLVNVCHDWRSQVSKYVMGGILRFPVGVDDVGKFLRRHFVGILNDDRFECSKELFRPILTFWICKNYIGYGLAVNRLCIEPLHYLKLIFFEEIIEVQDYGLKLAYVLQRVNLIWKIPWTKALAILYQVGCKATPNLLIIDSHAAHGMNKTSNIRLLLDAS